MWKLWVIFGLGFLILLVPFLGMPLLADRIFFLILGGGVMTFTFLSMRDMYFLLRARSSREATLPKTPDSSEHPALYVNIPRDGSRTY